MASHAFLKVNFLFSLLIFQNGVEGGWWNISADEDIDFEKRLKELNKPAVKTIVTDHGDIFDCVDFYKQPAFDHPLLKNYQVDFDPLKASKFPRKPLDHVLRNKSEDTYKYMELKDGGCPIGTVPIRRITKEDLIREKLVADTRLLDIDGLPGAQYAVAKTGQGGTLDGASGTASVYQPPATGQQYSAGRIKIFLGRDSLELGWRVDPSLYPDSVSRLFIRTDAGETHCFDTLCSGFIVVDTSIPLGLPLLTSQRGGPITALPLSINRDIINGNWWVEVFGGRRIGFWPQPLFPGSAASAEWGGEVFGPPGSSYPAMGAGYIPQRRDTDYDAFFSHISVITKEKITEPENMRILDGGHYKATDEGQSGTFGYLMFFGGTAMPN